VSAFFILRRLQIKTQVETDLLIIGGGINGTGIARDAAGRGLSVVLVEQGDLAAGTSSASSKLVHGGLRYLEQLQFSLVAEALGEREVLLRTAPHLVRPLRFVMPHVPEVRPAWMIRSGLLLYDWLARRDTLPRSNEVNLLEVPYASALQPRYTRGYAYSDCCVDDARLVIANARAAADLGARILPRTMCFAARRDASRWRVRLKSAAGESEVSARALVNAAGPWAERVLIEALQQPAKRLLRLVQGSHIVVPSLYRGEHAYIVQNDDRRVIFVCPYEGDYTLIGTTEIDIEGGEIGCQVSPAEVDYLCRAANGYFARQVRPSDVVWSYCGVRALVDDGGANASRVSREYLLRLDGNVAEAPLLSVLGGKITTYRRLAERALEKLAPWFQGMAKPWTAGVALAGGELPTGPERYVEDLTTRYPKLPRALLRALTRRHGSRVPAVLTTSRSVVELGEHYGADLYAREVDYFIEQEWAREAEDVLWRRTKMGLWLSPEQQGKLRAYMARRSMPL
jgi:glycerol-3-phosphate dehydrogenase